MKRLLASIAFLILGASAAFGQCNPFVSSLPASTIVGRPAGSAGPCEAVPFSTFEAALIASMQGGSGLVVANGANPFTYIAPGTNVAAGLALGANSGNGFETYNGLVAVFPTLLAADLQTALSAATYAGQFTTLSANSTLSGRLVGSQGNVGVAAPAIPAVTSPYKMQGLAGAITPSRSGNVFIAISGTITDASSTSANVGVEYQISYGTGGAPSNGGTLAGTQACQVQQYTAPIAPTAFADVNIPFEITCVVTGLTLGTAYWIDLAAASITTASNYGFINVNVAVLEN